MACKKCGSSQRLLKEKVASDDYGNELWHEFYICNKCGEKEDMGVTSPPKQKKKDSALSIWAAVLGFFTCTCFIGGILGIVDLCMNDKEKRHIGSWFAIAFCVLWTIVLISTAGGSEDDKPQSNNTNQVTEQSVVQQTSTQPPSEENIIDNFSDFANSQTVNEKPEQENVYYTEGMYFETSELRITINSIDTNYNDYDDEYGWYTPEDGMKYVSASFTYENIGDSDAYVSIYDYDCYADDTLMEQTYYFSDDFINANLSPGRNISFETFYIVPIDAKEIELEYSEFISWSDEKIIIKLQ